MARVRTLLDPGATPGFRVVVWVLLTIRQAAEASGLAPETIRYYERIGVLPRVQRGSNSYRRYPVEHVETLRFARRLRELGLAPAAMADLIRLVHSGTCEEMRDALLERSFAALEQVRAQRLELDRVGAQLGTVLEGLRAQPADGRGLAAQPCPCVTVVQEERPC